MAERVRFISPLERVLHMKRIAPLEEFGPRTLAVLAGYAHEAHAGAGEVLLAAGDTVDRVTLVVEGEVEVRPEGGEPTRHRAPWAFGFLHLVARVPSDITVTAVEDVLVLELDGDALEDLYEDDTALMYRQIQELSRHLLAERMRTIEGRFMTGERDSADPPREMGLIDRVLYMREAQLFRQANMDAVVELARRFSVDRFPPGAVLWRAGDPSGYTRVLLHGTVRGDLPDGRSFRAGKGYPLGNLESQSAQPRWYDATAETDIVTVRVDTDNFNDVLEDHFEMAFDFFSGVARNYLGMLKRRREAGEPIPSSGVYGLAEEPGRSG